MFYRLGRFTSQHWLLVITAWVLAVVVLRWLAPVWEDITRDGDLAYLPKEMPSVVGEELLATGFPHNRPKSQIAFFGAREDGPLDKADLAVVYDLARRLKNLQGVVALTRGRQLSLEAETDAANASDEETGAVRARAAAEFEKAKISLDEAIRLDDTLAAYIEKEADREAPSPWSQPPPRLAEAYLNRSLLNTELDRPDAALADRQQALALDAGLAAATDPLPAEAAELPLLDVWTWLDDVFGKKLSTRQTRVIILQLSNEFMATNNIEVLNYLEGILDSVREAMTPAARQRLQLGYSGSAAVGGDLLRAAKDSIKNTELFTVVLVVLILGLVYRSPLLVLMPLVTISMSLMAATSLVGLLTQLNQLPGFEWWTFKVFTTTKIFIVVILFGAGTDFFLFLVSRYKEELQHGLAAGEAVARSLAGVGDALVASALTTILGLSTMFFADFGKFSNSGPAIALCLAVTLLACLTLAPALLRACGPAVFWPFGIAGGGSAPADGDLNANPPASGNWFWKRAADAIVRHPGLILIGSVLILLPLAHRGVTKGNHITYDFLRQLPVDRPSRQGAQLMAKHFPVGESGPLLVIVYDPNGGFDSNAGREQIRDLTAALYLEGVDAVRSITDPLGDFPPGAKVGLFRSKSWMKLIASPHPRTQEIFVATSGPLAGKLTRLDVITQYDPFSVQASEVLERVEDFLRAHSQNSASPWYGSTFAFSGTTAGIRDLKLVTQSDNRRIQILVVLAVLAVLLAILRRPVICFYMIMTVLFSYYVTLGATEWFFSWADGAEFRGLDWKVPLFLFVILVAIGQDYNVYLATRVFEEQRRRGRLEGLRQGVVRTGGIITSCGIIMAGTFSAMTSGDWGRFIPAWVPGSQSLFGAGGHALPAIVQLGFALTLGVMLDTFIVRPILLPSALALIYRCRGDRPDDDSGEIGSSAGASASDVARRSRGSWTRRVAT